MSPPAKPARTGFDRPYMRGDAIPAPEVTESNSDTAWDTFNALQAKQEAHFADTAPASIPMPLPKGDPRYALTAPSALQRNTQGAPLAPKPTRHASIDQTAQEARRNNRVCPKPEFWQRIYDTLPDDGHGKRPSPPLTGQAWSATPSLSKRMCLREHIEWAAAHGALDRVLAMMKELPEQHWHHMGD